MCGIVAVSGDPDERLVREMLFMKVLLRRHISALWLKKSASGCST